MVVSGRLEISSNIEKEIWIVGVTVRQITVTPTFYLSLLPTPIRRSYFDAHAKYIRRDVHHFHTGNTESTTNTFAQKIIGL